MTHPTRSPGFPGLSLNVCTSISGWVTITRTETALGSALRVTQDATDGTPANRIALVFLSGPKARPTLRGTVEVYSLDHETGIEMFKGDDSAPGVSELAVEVFSAWFGRPA